MTDKQLLFVLIAALLVSFSISTGVFLYHASFHPVGHVANNATGTVSITITSLLSITLVNNTINFGSCAVNRTVGYMILDSSLNETQANNDRCIAGVYPDSLRLQNDGSFDANVTATFSLNGQTYFNDADSWFAYKSVNATTNGGCIEDVPIYTNVTSNTTAYPVCQRLVYGPNSSLVDVFVRARINVTATVNDSLSINFAASISN